MKISILTSDFSNNCFGRSWLLAKVLQNKYAIEMIGPVYGDGIWEPFKNFCDFEIKMVKGYANGKFEFKRMLNMISGEVIYASKPLLASFGVGLTKKIITGKPLVLDIDDWELGFGNDFHNSLVWFKKINDFRLSRSNWQSYYYTLFLNKFINFSNAITVSGPILQSQYGGTIVTHGRDVHFFDPEKFDSVALKKKTLAEKDADAFVVGFIGTPRPHKGLEDLIDAMELLIDKNMLLLIVGIDEGEYCSGLKNMIINSKLQDRAMLLPPQPFEILPELLAIADVLVIPQRERAASRGQVPAKIIDAMAMAKPIITTNVSGIPEILNKCGWIIEPENPEQLANSIQYIHDHPMEAYQMGLKAREMFKRKYTWEVMEEKLTAIFEQLRS